MTTYFHYFYYFFFLGGGVGRGGFKKNKNRITSIALKIPTLKIKTLEILFIYLKSGKMFLPKITKSEVPTLWSPTLTAAKIVGVINSITKKSHAIKSYHNGPINYQNGTIEWQNRQKISPLIESILYNLFISSSLPNSKRPNIFFKKKLKKKKKKKSP